MPPVARPAGRVNSKVATPTSNFRPTPISRSAEDVRGQVPEAWGAKQLQEARGRPVRPCPLRRFAPMDPRQQAAPHQLPEQASRFGTADAVDLLLGSGLAVSDQGQYVDGHRR